MPVSTVNCPADLRPAPRGAFWSQPGAHVESGRRRPRARNTANHSPRSLRLPFSSSRFAKTHAGPRSHEWWTWP